MKTETDFVQYRLRLAKHRSVLYQNIVTPDEFVLKVIDDLLTVQQNDVEACIAELDSDELANVNAYFDTHVRTNDFDPSPVAFLSPTDDFESAKQILRAKYSELDKLLMEEECAD